MGELKKKSNDFFKKINDSTINFFYSLFEDDTFEIFLKEEFF